MKILWLSHLIPYPPKAGVLLRCYHLIHELSKYHSVDLLSFIQRDFMASFFPSYAEGIKESMEVLSSYCGKVQFVPIPSESQYRGKHLLALTSLFRRDPYTINWLKSKVFYDDLKLFLREERYDMVHFDTISLCPYKGLIQGVPTVIDHHNIESDMMLRRASNEKNVLLKSYYWQEGLRLRKYEKKHCHLFDLNITCSALDSQRLLQADGNICVKEIPNGVDLRYFKPSNSVSVPNTLVFVGSMNWYPNIEAMQFFLVHIWPLIKKRVPDCVMHIVGANPPDHIKKFSLNDKNIQVHGFVEDVRPFIERAAVYICPIRDGGGTKLKLLDAFAMKKAVVAHPVACEGINAQPDRDVLFAESPEDFVEKICMLFADSKLRQVLGENARRMVGADYSFEKIGKRLSGIYEELIFV